MGAAAAVAASASVPCLSVTWMRNVLLLRDSFTRWMSAPDTALPTYYGPQTLHELMERTTWHCGQNVRQYMMLLEKEGVALDIAGYRAAPPGLRIWCGATVDKTDIQALAPWLDWAWQEVKG